MLCVVMPFCLGQRVSGRGTGSTLVLRLSSADDVAVWPYSVGLLVVLILGLVVFLLLKYSFYTSCGLVRGWSWRRPFSGIGGLDAQFQCRLFRVVQALIFGVPAGSLGALFGLRALPGGFGRFLPSDIGANHCRLRHIGWEKCGHGLTSRPRESASERFLNELLVLFRYPAGSALLEGTVPPRYCAGRFASRIPSWRLAVHGHVAGLVAEEGGREEGDVEGGEVDVVRVEHCSDAVLPGFAGGGRVVTGLADLVEA